MPISRYEIRNEYSLADPDIYKAADKDDPEALLEGVAMAGLVGLLRQLGDLAEFAAEIFHDLHEEVIATATRGHGLMVRVQQLESEFPSIEKAFLSQTSHLAFFSNGGTDWHPSLHTTQNLITRGDLPRFVMDSYEECRGPPRLFLLDKFDVAGAGACLTRYTDPSFFKVDTTSYGMTTAEIQREKKSHKIKKKNSRWRNGGTPEVLPPSHAKLHQLFLEEQVQNGISDPARLVKLKQRPNGFLFDSKSRKSYMEKFISTSLPEDKLVDEISYGSLSLELPPVVNSGSGFELLENNPVSSVKESVRRKISPYSSQSVKKTIQRPSINGVREDVSGRELSWIPNQYPNSDASVTSSLHEAADEKEIAVYGEQKADDYLSDDIASDEVDNYMDALATMESEIKTDREFRTKNELGLVNIEKKQGTDSDANEEQLEALFTDSQSVGNSSASEDGKSSYKKEISSFSYSDAGSTSADNTPADFDASAIVLTSADIFDTEVTDTSIENVYTVEEIAVCQPSKNEGSFSASTEIAEIPSHASEFGDSVAVHVPEDQGEILVGGTCSGAELHEMSSSHDELDKEFIMTHITHQNETNTDVNLPCTSLHSDHPSHSSQDVPLTDTNSAGNLLLDKLDNEERNISNDTIHFSNTLDGFQSEYVSEILLENELQTELAEDICTQNLVSGEFGLPQSVTSNVEDESIVLALVEFENLQPEFSDSVNDAVQSAGEITMDATDASDNSDNISFTEQHGLEQTEDVPPSKTGSAEVGICYGQEFSELEVLNKVDGVEMGGITSSMHILGSEDTALEISSDSWKPTGSGLHASDAGEVDGESSFERNSQAEYLHSIQELVQNEFHVYNGRFLLRHNESAKQKEIFIGKIPSPSSESDLLMCVPDSSLAAEAEIRLCLDEAIMASSSAECYSQDSESIASEQSKCIENTGGALPSASQHDYLAMTFFDQKLMKQGDQLDIGQPDVDEEKYEEIPVSELVQYMDHEEISVLEQVQSMDHMNEGSSDAHSELFLGTNEPAVQVGIRPDCLNMTSLHDDETGSESSHLEKMQIANPVDEIKSKKISESEQGQSMDYVDKGSTDAHSDSCLGENKAATQVDIQADCLYIKSLHGDETSLLSSSQLDETQSKDLSVSEQAESMDHIDGGTYAHSEPCLVANKPTVQVYMHADCLDNNPSHGDEASFESTQFEQLQFTDHTDHERLANASSRSFTLHSPIEDSELEIAEAGSHKVDISDEPVNPLTSVSPSSSLHSEIPQINSESVSPLPAEQMQFPDCSDQERAVTAPKSLSLHLQNADSESEFAQLGNYNVGISEQARDPPSSVPPSFYLLPEVPKINLEEMPPLPPLPPVQWRIGRPQHVSLSSDMQNTFALFPPIFSAKANNNTHMGYSALNMDGLPPPVPILTMSDVKDEDCEHVHEHLPSSMVHSSPLVMQMPNMSSDKNRQDDFRTSGGTPNMIPFLTLPSTSNDSPQHELRTREVGILPLSSSSYLSISSTGDEAGTFSSASPCECSSHPLQHLPQETSLDNDTFRDTTISPETMMVNTDANLAVQAPEDEHPKHVSRTSEEEPVRTNTSLLPTLEDGIPDWKRPMKLMRPRSPLIDAVAAHDKSKLRKVTERVRPEIQKVEEKDTLLEQIRAKSFNLKPALVTRPSIQGPTTNLRVAAILEKANAIRQALAGSDEDDDDDSWSDS